MENSNLFNAGRGSVLDCEGNATMDASIMEGEYKTCGSVIGIENIKNPISCARNIMEKSTWVCMHDKGAYQFAEKMGLETVSPNYFQNIMK